MSQATRPDEGFPPALKHDNWTTQIIRDLIYKPAVLENDWSFFVVVGREGSGKSYTCASILAACDPNFGVHRTHFDPVNFLRDIANAPDRPGVAIMGDETGVGFGKRTWHDREQIEANQALQTARDDNRIIGITLPRIEELDSQLQGRVHLQLETKQKKPDDWVQCAVKVVDPSRDGAGKIYKKYPRYMQSAFEFKPQRIKITPPPQSWIDEYEPKKKEWKKQLYDRTIDRYQDEREETKPERTPKMVFESIKEDGGFDQYVFIANNGREYVDEELIGADYNLSKSKRSMVKKMIAREIGLLGESGGE